mgnify:CR=1 FL=1
MKNKKIAALLGILLAGSMAFSPVRMRQLQRFCIRCQVRHLHFGHHRQIQRFQR